ncbi:hypothetical protein [Herbaspirillum sp. alder98]|uniref:hypothetical protein n=1 Tax=Herbaspirillum sp. alder98 TaxID=2913096 RepID=UPI001CD8F136|nr:hypothetical protein [Herbaspirillum sp. alder98]MCA1322855.1 hypothetical protein [Herbaspirillum sp. alder98]
MSQFSMKTAAIGQALPTRSYQAGTVQLFLYNAAIWNAHRIHYDLPYAQGVEQHPALLVDGPLQGDWLMQLVYELMDAADELQGFSYQNRQSAYVDEVLTLSGQVAAVDGERVTLTLSLANTRGQITTMGQATVRRATH